LIGDLARWLFWVHLREVVDPEEPGLVRAIASVASRAQLALTPEKRRLMRLELLESFPKQAWTERTLDRVSRSAYDLQVQCLCEELMLGRLDAESVQRFMRFDGRENLDRALADGKGVVLLFPHAGNVMLLIALLSLSGYDFTQVAARGLPPPDKAVTADLRDTWFNRRARQAREANEDALPARFHTIDAPPRELYRRLAANGIVAIAFDGRGGTKFRPVTYLGRTALLSTGPWRLAASTGARVVPAFCVRERDRSHRLVLFPALSPDPGLPVAERCERLLETFLRQHIEPMLEKHPDHYARWLVHCREHAGLDDHPLFVDTAADERWRVHEKTEW
jgi:lauroyl/myristoyl acyltransferase